ncbi:uncharacterized protein LOC122899224 [Neovison vison]|uniref:uncharacterized protein LOC122899224 n=1 Tax=Neovison vison TaxID=452646 RepID=UPI001CF090D8|nr:uncharacterized protein LOC122899224 [Neogale vison]
MGNLSCCCTEICGECLSEDVEPPPTTPTPPPPRRRRRRRRKKRVRFNLHDDVYIIEDTEETPYDDLVEELLPTLRAEEEIPSLPPQEAATGYVPYAYSPVIPFRETDLAEQGRAHSSSVHTDELPTSTLLSTCARQAKLPERFPKSSIGVPTLSVCIHLDSLASVDDDLDVDSREGEAPLFTKVVALLERESVLTDLLVESIEDYSTSDDEVSSASSLLSDPEKDSTEDNNSDERSHPAPLSRSFPSVDMVQTTREAEEEEDSGTGCATGQCAHHPEAPEAPGVLRQREPGGPWGPTCGSDLGPEEDSA